MHVKCQVAFVKSLQTVIKAEIRRVQTLKLHPEQKNNLNYGIPECFNL